MVLILNENNKQYLNHYQQISRKQCNNEFRRIFGNNDDQHWVVQYSIGAFQIIT